MLLRYASFGPAAGGSRVRWKGPRAAGNRRKTRRDHDLEQRRGRPVPFSTRAETTPVRAVWEVHEFSRFEVRMRVPEHPVVAGCGVNTMNRHRRSFGGCVFAARAPHREAGPSDVRLVVLFVHSVPFLERADFAVVAPLARL